MLMQKKTAADTGTASSFQPYLCESDNSKRNLIQLSLKHKAVLAQHGKYVQFDNFLIFNR